MVSGLGHGLWAGWRRAFGCLQVSGVNAIQRPRIVVLEEVLLGMPGNTVIGRGRRSSSPHPATSNFDHGSAPDSAISMLGPRFTADAVGRRRL